MTEKSKAAGAGLEGSVAPVKTAIKLRPGKLLMPEMPL